MAVAQGRSLIHAAVSHNQIISSAVFGRHLTNNCAFSCEEQPFSQDQFFEDFHMFRKISIFLVIISLFFGGFILQTRSASAAGETVNVWMTTPDQSKLLAAQTPLVF